MRPIGSLPKSPFPSPHCLVLCLAVLASSALAEPITFRFEGTVTSNHITRAPWNAAVVGDPAFIEYTFESSTPDSDGTPDEGTYLDAVRYFTVGVGSEGAGGFGGDIAIVRNFGPDAYQENALRIVDQFEVALLLNAPQGSVLTGDALPSALVLEDWNLRRGDLIDQIAATRLSINWTSFRVVPPLKACCHPTTGACGLAAAADCAALGGSPQAVASCSPIPCLIALPTGACCEGVGCTVTVSFACFGGVWQGANTTCQPAPGVNRCCRADFNNSGTVSVQDIFDFLAAYFAGCP